MRAIIGVVFSLLISLVVPIIVFIFACVKRRFAPYLLGVLAFTVSQVVIRIPILKYIQEHSTAYHIFSITQPILFAIVIGLSAGVFEGMARFVMMRYFMKQKDWQSGFLFGAGHGGIEAILFVGINAVTYVFSPLAIAYNSSFFIGGIERLFAMLLHIGLSIIVLKGIVHKKFSYVLVAILIHGLVDSLIGILPIFLPGEYVLLSIELSLAIIASAVFIYSLLIKRKGSLQ